MPVPVAVRSRPFLSLAATAFLLLAARPASAQGSGSTNPPRSTEIGIDAGAVFGLGSQSSIKLDLPATRARIGFFLPKDGRWSIEPALGFSYSKVEDSDGVLVYNVEMGGLYHFRPGSDMPGANHASTAYLRPFVAWTGFTGDNGDSEVSAGGGLGVKIPWRPGVAWRLEGNVGYGFDNEAFRVGGFVGLSVFTRRTP
jgi:hypothetical protein